MELLIAAITLLSLIGTGILAARLGCYKKQNEHLLQELELVKQEETNILFTCVSSVGRTQDIVRALNELLERHRQIKERLLRENRSYRQSITSISHDIRTPLTSAKGYMQMLRCESLPMQKRSEYAKIVEQRLDTLTDMLDQLFLYTRIEAGELPLTIEKINLTNLFADTISMFYDDFLCKNCEPDVQIAQTPCHIQADRQALIRIVENLLKNALIHGTGDYELSLTIRHSCACMRIANRTDSIEPSDIDYIFDRFYTTDLSRSRKTTGLGLAIVKELTQQMGGTVAAALDDSVFSIEVCFCLPESDAVH